MRTFNENKESELHLRIKKKEWVNQQGQTVIQTEWVIANGDVSLGSMANPKEDILDFRYDIPDNKSLFDKFIGK